MRKLVLMDGTLPAKLHQDELLENWRLCEQMQVPNPILPLK
nr:hypothetical protein [uncultured Duganella sp.]